MGILWNSKATLKFEKKIDWNKINCENILERRMNEDNDLIVKSYILLPNLAKQWFETFQKSLKNNLKQ